MKRKLVLAALLAVIAALFLHQPPRYRIWGYYPYWLGEEWKRLDLGAYDSLLFFEIPIRNGGELSPPVGWPEHAPGSGQAVFSLFDRATFERLFPDASARDRLVGNIVSLSKSGGLSGIQLDIEIQERVSRESAEGFRAFVAALRKASRGRALSLFVLSDDAAGLYDAKLFGFFDYLVLQGYDAHWRTGPSSGPISQLGGTGPDAWKNQLEKCLSLGVPRSRILFAIPYFGYEWPTRTDRPGAPTTGPGSIISYAPVRGVPEIAASAESRVRDYGMRRDPDSGSPYYVFRNGGQWIQGWFEDGNSLSGKLEFVKREHLAGIAAFPLGYDGGKFSALLRQKLR